MLTATAVGNLGNDAQIKEANGKQFVTFDIAHNERYKDASGTAINKTVWISCIYSRSTNIAPYLKKGTTVSVSGLPSATAWQDRNNNLRSGLQLTVMHLELHGASTGTQQQSSNGGYKQPQQQQQPQPAQMAAEPGGSGEEDDLPF